METGMPYVSAIKKGGRMKKKFSGGLLNRYVYVKRAGLRQPPCIQASMSPAGKQLQQVDTPIDVSPFIVVPAVHLRKALLHYQRALRVDEGGLGPIDDGGQHWLRPVVIPPGH